MIMPFRRNQQDTRRSDHKSYHNTQTGPRITDKVHMLFHMLWQMYYHTLKVLSQNIDFWIICPTKCQISNTPDGEFCQTILQTQNDWWPLPF